MNCVALTPFVPQIASLPHRTWSNSNIDDLPRHFCRLPENPCFMGRTEVLNDLGAHLRERKAVGGSSAAQTAGFAVTGLPGVGKT